MMPLLHSTVHRQGEMKNYHLIRSMRKKKKCVEMLLNAASWLKLCQVDGTYGTLGKSYLL